MPKHFDYGGSALGRIIHCPGSLKHLKANPTPSTQYSEKGSEAHKIAEEILKGADPFEIECEASTLEFAMGYAQVVQDVIDNLRDATGEEPTVIIEKQIGTELEGVMIGGTPDCLVYVDGHELHVIDAKNGFEFVNPACNWQLRSYTYAAIEELGLFVEDVVTHVYQPNSLGDRDHREAREGMDWMKAFPGFVRGAKEKAEADDPIMITGEHCQFCNKAECPLHQENMEEVAKIDTDIEKCDDAKLLRILEVAPLVSSMEKQARALLTERAKAGQQIEGMKLVKVQGNRDWKQGTPSPITASKRVGLTSKDFYAPPKTLSPTQVEKKIQQMYKGKDNTAEREKFLSALSEMVERPDRGVKLVDAKAKGEPVNTTFDKSDDIEDEWE